MRVRRSLVLMLVVSLLAVPGLTPLAPAPPARAQGVEVWIKATGSGSRKLNIAVPEFTVTTGTDAGGAGKILASVAGADLTFEACRCFLDVAAQKRPPELQRSDLGCAKQLAAAICTDPVGGHQ